MGKTPGKVVRLDTGYRPRPLQEAIHRNLKRFNVLVIHRRFGKTILCLNEILDRAIANPLRNPRYAYIAPTYKQAKRIAWDPIREYAKRLAPTYDESKQELTVIIRRDWLPEPDEVKIILLGSDEPDSLRGLYLDGVIMDEFAQCSPIIWGEIVRPALADRGGWAIFIGTPKGQNHFYKRYLKAKNNPAWYTCMYKASETGVISDEELELMRLEMDPEEYEQEMECSFTAATRGSYYGEIIHKLEKDGRLGDFPYNPGLPVDTYWDLGMHDAMSVWFRQTLAGGQYSYIDYLEVNGKSIPEVAVMIKAKPYSYGRHVLPWDANTKEMGTGTTRLEQARKHLKGVQIQKRQAINDRIQATRILLPRCYFNAKIAAVDNAVEKLKNYQKEWDPKKELFTAKPVHDHTSHAADSFGYSALDLRMSFFQDNHYDELPRSASNDYNELGG